MSTGFGGFAGGFGGPPKERHGVHFHPADPGEQQELMQGLNPKYQDFECGHCGRSTNGRVLCSFNVKGSPYSVYWCHCSCEKKLPTMLIDEGYELPVTQYPEACEFHPGLGWPDDLIKLYEEAARSFAAKAYTASAMVARKILMACACHEGADDGRKFVEYVDYVSSKVLTFAKAKDSIDAIRTIGNDANHSIQFVTREDARRALSIVTYLLNTIYSLPQA
jgi:hypothetical protein